MILLLLALGWIVGRETFAANQGALLAGAAEEQSITRWLWLLGAGFLATISFGCWIAWQALALRKLHQQSQRRHGRRKPPRATPPAMPRLAAATPPAIPAPDNTPAIWPPLKPAECDPVSQFSITISKSSGTLEAQEVLDIFDLIDMWLAMDRPDVALKFLAPYRKVRHVSSPVPWLGLLQVYFAMDDRENYEAIASRLMEFFNVKVPAWDAREQWSELTSLAEVPHVRQRILDLWGTEELGSYLNTLVLDDRGDRSGFAIGIFKDLARLHQIQRNAGDKQAGQAGGMEEAQAMLFSEAKPAIPPSIMPKPPKVSAAAQARESDKRLAARPARRMNGMMSASREATVTKDLIHSADDTAPGGG
ncbi:hypothetical protein [Noviherbaspirillum galbum]|uniref:Uncharacterized protein n=1 Tax=Noviherbaspirillum galbum TaxID=2709383 RepID=A0A6B3SMI1_9BURK|nr:hypothetical protein [Noviherbaspirillum galbum]NEX61917.1 hypothetical protein [Noviherbaspirillum galbum]